MFRLYGYSLHLCPLTRPCKTHVCIHKNEFLHHLCKQVRLLHIHVYNMHHSMQTYDRSSTLTEIATPDYLGYENVDMDFLVILLTLFKGRLEVEVE